MKMIFGPIFSRRFGLCLGVDLSPSHKQCNYDCLYCELAPAKPVAAIDDPPTPQAVISQLKKALKRYPNVETITVTANGEPTLYPFLLELIKAIDTIKGQAKTLILSNASTIAEQRVQEALRRFDRVKLSFDCATEHCFKKLDRPHHTITLSSIIEGIQAFGPYYDGELLLEILLVAGLNTTPREIAAFNKILPTFCADRIDIGTIDRPPAYPVLPLDHAQIDAFIKALNPSLPIHAVYRSIPQRQHNRYSRDEIIETLQKRPMTKEEIEQLFDKASSQLLEALLQEKVIVVQENSGQLFYTVATKEGGLKS